MSKKYREERKKSCPPPRAKIMWKSAKKYLEKKKAKKEENQEKRELLDIYPMNWGSGVEPLRRGTPGVANELGSGAEPRRPHSNVWLEKEPSGD